MKGRAILGSLVAACAGLIVFIFVQFRGGDGPRVGLKKAEAACREGSPDCLPRLTFVDTAGNVLTPESLAGKVVILNFWATWCGPCQAEIPDLAAIHTRYKDRGVVLLGVLNEQPRPSDGALAAFASDFGINYPLVHADEEILRAFEYPEALPTTFIYDRRGHARYARPGSVSSRQLQRVLDELLAE